MKRGSIVPLSEVKEAVLLESQGKEAYCGIARKGVALRVISAWF